MDDDQLTGCMALAFAAFALSLLALTIWVGYELGGWVGAVIAALLFGAGKGSYSRGR